MSVRIPKEATGFGVRASEYEAGRPAYPDEAVSYLVANLGIGPGSRVVDLAAGTGKLTRQLVPTGALVTAVEPVEGMREVLAQAVPGVEVLDGTAERIPLPDGSADAVCVAQAFHWFRGQEALAEIYRVLGGHGRLGLAWNVRDLSQPLQAALEEVMARYRGSSPSYSSDRWRDAFGTTELFSELTVGHFPMEQEVSRQELVARALSTSFIACLPPAEQHKVADEVAALAPAEDHFTMRYHTDVYWCSIPKPAREQPLGPPGEAK